MFRLHKLKWIAGAIALAILGIGIWFFYYSMKFGTKPLDFLFVKKAVLDFNENTPKPNIEGLTIRKAIALNDIVRNYVSGIIAATTGVSSSTLLLISKFAKRIGRSLKRKLIKIGIVATLICAISLGIFIVDTKTVQNGQYEYEVTLNNADIGLKQLYEQYDIIDVKDGVYTIREKR